MAGAIYNLVTFLSRCCRAEIAWPSLKRQRPGTGVVAGGMNSNRVTLICCWRPLICRGTEDQGVWEDAKFHASLEACGAVFPFLHGLK